jgi:hypothetical protein
MTDGVDLAKGRRALAGLTREQLAAHERMATLPRTVHRRPERSHTAARIEGADQSNRAKAAKGGRRGQGISLPGSRPAK